MDWDEIIIKRSNKRKKTVQAKIIGTTLQIYLPNNLPKSEEKELIEQMKERMKRKKQQTAPSSNEVLQKRAEQLNNHYFNGSLSFTIKFVTNQQRKFGSCTPLKKSIRISDRCSTMPTWVLDYIIVHELTHLIHPNHSKAFWKHVHKYPLVERAKGFLIGYEFANNHV